MQTGSVPARLESHLDPDGRELLRAGRSRFFGEWGITEEHFDKIFDINVAALLAA
jgi:hypothetical protein